MLQKIYLFISLITLLRVQQAEGQKVLPADNLSIRFTVLRTSLQLLDSNRVSPSRNMIQVEMSDTVKIQLKALPKTVWMDWLQNKSTDWAANLILYDLYQKDAFLYWNIIKKRSDWMLAAKEDDLAYWSNTLK